MSSISEILECNRVDGMIHTHVSLISPKGKFQFDRNALEEFWKIYLEIVHKSPETSLGIAEKPQHYLPVLVDVDLKMNVDDDDNIPERLYEDPHIISVIEIYQSVLRNIVEDCSDENLICLVLEKPLYVQIKGDNTYVKNGFHLHFPFTFLNKVDQEIHLIPRVKQQIKEINTFRDIGFKNSDELIDKSYSRVPWLLYGSKKSEDQNSYKVTMAFDASGEQISLQEALSNYKIFNQQEEQIQFTKPIKYYFPRILSILPYGRDVCEVKSDLVCPMKENMNDYGNQDKKRVYNDLSVEENLKLAERFLRIISDNRANDRDDWMTIGWVLFNIGEGSKKGLELWIEFSHRCPEKFQESVCVYEWNRMVKKDLSIGTLRYFAREDNSEEYIKIVSELMKPHIDNSLSGSHNDIAKALSERYGEQFVCASIAYKSWYEYQDHTWNKVEEGITLRTKISDELVNRYVELGNKYLMQLSKCNDEAEKAMYNVRVKNAQRMINNLKSCPYKNNVMRECMEVFYDSTFHKKLDSNAWTIGFKNGIYDLKNNVFRQGRPGDFTSMKMGVNYIEDLSDKDSRVLEVYDFLEKVFPDKSVRDYFLDTSSDVFVGGNSNKLVLLWSGEGDNAKSVTQTIFEKMLGNYAIKLPTALITGKRTQSSAACPELARAGNGVRWAVLQEPDQKDVINIGILKELSGNDTFFARGLYKEGGEINPMFKLVLICNEPPKLPYSDKATWNRIRVIPFESTFCNDAPETYEEQLLEKKFPKDPHFVNKIPDMIEAFAWILINHRRKVRVRTEPEKVKLATANYRKKNDIYRQFIEECVTHCEDNYLGIIELYGQFKEWYKDSMPNHGLPIKNEVKEYFSKLWGEPEYGCKWKGYKIIPQGTEIVLEEKDLVNHENLPPI